MEMAALPPSDETISALVLALGDKKHIEREKAFRQLEASLKALYKGEGRATLDDIPPCAETVALMKDMILKILRNYRGSWPRCI